MGSAGRDDQGRFAKGAPAGPGRPPRRAEREILERLRTLCTDDRIDAVLLRLIADAAQGRADARKLLLAYVIGKPTTAAPTLTQLAIDDETGADPLAWDIAIRSDDEI